MTETAPLMPAKAVLLGLAMVVAAALPLSTSARDLGVHGTVFEIIEPDFRMAMVASAAQVDWEAIERDRRESVDRYLSEQKNYQLPTAERTTLVWTDMTVTVKEDVRVPVKTASGEYEEQLLYAKGDRVNPLERIMPTQALLLFDGRSAEQAHFAKGVAQVYGVGVALLDTSGGHPGARSEEFQQPVFAPNDWLISRFGVQSVPSLIFPGKPNGEPRIGVLSLAAPYRVDVIEPYWNRSLFTQTNDLSGMRADASD